MASRGGPRTIRPRALSTTAIQLQGSANGCNNCSAKGSATRRHVRHTCQQNDDNEQHQEVMLDIVAVWPSDHALRCRIVTSASFHVEKVNDLWLACKWESAEKRDTDAPCGR